MLGFIQFGFVLLISCFECRWLVTLTKPCNQLNNILLDNAMWWIIKSSKQREGTAWRGVEWWGEMVFPWCSHIDTLRYLTPYTHMAVVHIWDTLWQALQPWENQKRKQTSACLLAMKTTHACPKMYTSIHTHGVHGSRFHVQLWHSNLIIQIKWEREKTLRVERKSKAQAAILSAACHHICCFFSSSRLYLLPIHRASEKRRGWKKERGHQRKREERENCSRHQRKCVNAGSCFLWSRMFRDGL